jgi:hypothetical protein
MGGGEKRLGRNLLDRRGGENVENKKLTKWETGDTCPGCYRESMIFYLSDYAWDKKGRLIYYGRLSCANCGWEQDAYCYDYQAPPPAPCGSHCPSEGDACQFCPSNPEEEE